MEKDTKPPNHKRGYLNDDFNFFNLHDQKEIKIDLHHHDFCKIVIFISGNVTYFIEGTAYRLKPWDILLINRDTIHKPVIDASAPYQRMILWLKPSFLQKCSNTNSNLATCFELAQQRQFHLLRMSPQWQLTIKTLLSQISTAYHEQSFGHDLLTNSLLLQYIIYLNRIALDSNHTSGEIDIVYDETINKILQYIDTSITEDLSIEQLSSVFFLSKYYLMRKFKQYTGYSIHQYVLQKRLIAATQLLRAGKPVITACMESGFNDYANFTRAFKKMYGTSPQKYKSLSK